MVPARTAATSAVIAAMQRCSLLPRRFLSDELLGTLGTAYKNAAKLLSEFTQRAADECHSYWLRTRKDRPDLEDLLLHKVSLCCAEPCATTQW